MLGEKDLIYFGAILIWSNPAYAGNGDEAIKAAKKFYEKIFEEDGV